MRESSAPIARLPVRAARVDLPSLGAAGVGLGHGALPASQPAEYPIRATNQPRKRHRPRSGAIARRSHHEPDAPPPPNEPPPPDQPPPDEPDEKPPPLLLLELRVRRGMIALSVEA